MSQKFDVTVLSGKLCHTVCQETDRERGGASFEKTYTPRLGNWLWRSSVRITQTHESSLCKTPHMQRSRGTRMCLKKYPLTSRRIT